MHTATLERTEEVVIMDMYGKGSVRIWQIMTGISGKFYYKTLLVYFLVFGPCKSIIFSKNLKIICILKIIQNKNLPTYHNQNWDVLLTVEIHSFSS